jgi:hypothetical protein
VLIPKRWAIASSCSPSAINSSTTRCAGVKRSPGLTGAIQHRGP